MVRAEGKLQGQTFSHKTCGNVGGDDASENVCILAGIVKSCETVIVITAKAAEGLALLSQGAGTEADTYVNENEAPQFAVDGDISKKWCATGSVTRNTAGITHDTFAPVNARFVKLVVNKPTQGSDSAARIYEIEVYGLEEAVE